MSPNRRHQVFLALILAFLWGMATVARVGISAASEPIQTASIDNGTLRLTFDSRTGRLLTLEDLESSHNHVGDSAERRALWSLELVRDDQPTTLFPDTAKKFRCEVVPGAQSALRLTWEDFPREAPADYKVQVTVRLPNGEAMSHWSIAVECPPDTALQKLVFPRLTGLRRQKDEWLAVPLWMGQQLPDPRSRLSGSGKGGRRFAWSYPGMLSMQCLAYYRKGGDGLYIACDDNTARRKTHVFQGNADADVHYAMVHYPMSQAGESQRYELPYSVRIGTFRGDWFTAAQRYRNWAVEQPWARQSRLRRGLVPQWVAETGLWVWNRGRSPGVLPPAAALQERLGLPVRVFWHWWHGCPYDIGFPEYLPPREGTEAFRRAVAQAHDHGLKTLVYMNQRAWGLSTESWKAEGAQRYAVKAENGKIVPEVYNIFTGKALVSMCLATPFWRNKYAGLAEEAFRELGVDGIYMDQACTHKPCYDPDHGHPPGGGDSWIDGFRLLSEDIRGRCDKDRPIVLSGEGCGEAWLPYLDLMLALQVSRERYAAPTDPWQVFPFFQAVYHPYAITYGNYSSLVMPPYDDLWPAEFAPAEPLALLDKKFSYQFRLEQARTFVWGQQPALSNFVPSLFEQRPDEMEYLMRLARVRSRATKYLLHGEFLRPPELNVPEVTSDFSRLSIYAGQKDRLTTSRRKHPLALAGAWRAPDGDVAFALASIADRSLHLSLAVDREAYGIPARANVYRIDEDGRRRLERPSADDATLELDLPARQLWIIEFSKN